VNYCN